MAFSNYPDNYYCQVIHDHYRYFHGPKNQSIPKRIGPFVLESANRWYLIGIGQNRLKLADIKVGIGHNHPESAYITQLHPDSNGIQHNYCQTVANLAVSPNSAA